MAGPSIPVPDLSTSHTGSKLGTIFHLGTLHGINPENLMNLVEEKVDEIHTKLHDLFEPHLQQIQAQNGQAPTQ